MSFWRKWRTCEEYELVSEPLPEAEAEAESRRIGRGLHNNAAGDLLFKVCLRPASYQSPRAG